MQTPEAIVSIFAIVSSIYSEKKKMECVYSSAFTHHTSNLHHAKNLWQIRFREKSLMLSFLTKLSILMEKS